MKKIYFILFLSLLVVMNANAAPFWNTFDSNPSSNWTVDRYTPAAFESSFFDGDNRLHLSITQDRLERPSGQQTAFYNTHGKQIQTTISNPSVMRGKLYIPASWETSHRRSDIWGVLADASNAVTDYPIIGFANTTSSNPTFRVWDQDLSGGWVNISYTVNYNEWYDFIVEFTSTEYKYYINGNLVYTDNTINSNTTQLKAIIVQGYNFGDSGLLTEQQSFNDDYDIYWDDIAVYPQGYNVVNLTQNTVYNTIQSAINAANAGDEIEVAAGTYTELLNINKANLTVRGNGSSTTTLNTSSAGTNYGVRISANGVTFKGFNIIPSSSVVSPSKNGYTIHASNTPNIINGLTLEDIVIDATGIDNLQRTGVDIHGVDNPILNDITVSGCDFGNGVSLTGCTNASINNVSTSGNAWGGIAFYVSKYTSPWRACSNNTFDFNSNNIGEFVYIEDQFGLVNTNITIQNYTYGMNNLYVSPTDGNFTLYTNKPLNDALLLAAGLNVKFSNMLSYCWDPTLINYWVGSGMKIQRSIDVAANGNTINVANGTYNENLTISKNISIESLNGSAYTIIDGQNSGTQLGTIYLTTGRDGVVIGSLNKGFTIKGLNGNGSIEKAAIYLQGAQSNISIQGNIIEARGDAGLQGEYNASNNNIVINGNEFIGKTFVGSNPSGIGFSTQFNAGNNCPRQIVVFGGGPNTNLTQNFTFTNNIVSGIAGGISSDDGVSQQGNTLVTLDLVGTNTITGNTFSGFTNRYAEALRTRGSGTYSINGNVFNGSYTYNFTAATTNPLVGFARVADVWANNTFSKAVTVADASANFKINSIPTIIQLGITLASINDILFVKAGTYAEDIVVNKALDIRGPNYGINPNTGTRVAEAIIVPATSNPDINTGGQIIYLENAASGSKINGFTIDGDNPLLTSGVLMYGADVDVLEAISAYHGLSNVTVSNNIVKNLNYAGIDFYNYYNSGNATTGNLIENNLFENIIPSQYGIAVLIYNNCYTKIINNIMKDVRVGVQTGNFSKADPGNSRLIDNNLMNVSRRGIFHNLAYQSASGFTISNNIISTSTNGVSAEWDGILLSSLSVPSSSLNNNITGSSTAPSQAYEIWNVKSNAPAYISGGTLSNVDYGIFANNWEGYNSNGGDGAHATVENIQINPKSTGTGIYLHDNPSSAHANVQVTVGNGVAIENCANGVVIENANAKLVSIGENFNLDGISGDYFKLINNAFDIDATAVSFNGKVGSAMNLGELFAVESKLIHKVDNSALGLITFNANSDACISLNYNYASPIWIDNNSANSNATVPSLGSAPSFVANDTDFNNNNSVSFAGGTNILSIPYNNDVARLNGNTAKSFFVYFRTGSNVTSRQVVFEAGGMNSGYNVYIYNGKLYMGAWSSSARRFFYQTVSANTNYLVSIEYGATKIRVTVNGVPSTYLTLNGFTTESSDNGVGGSYNRTRYMDNISSLGIVNTFMGKIAEILCYNSNTQALRDDVIDYIDAKYGTNFNDNYYGKMVATNQTIDDYSWDEGDVEYSANHGLSVNNYEDNIEVVYTTTEAQYGKVIMYDINGQVINTIYNGMLNNGTNLFNVNKSAINSGFYFITVETNFGLESEKVIIVK